MAKRNTKGKLPRGVQRIGRGYRAWAIVGGKRVWSRTAPTVEMAAKIAEELRRGEKDVDDRPRTLQDAMSALEKATSNPETRAFYLGNWRIIQKHIPAGSLLVAIQPKHVEAMRDSMLGKVKPATVRRRLATLRRAFNLAQRKGWCHGNPVTSGAIEWPRETRKQMDYFEPEEWQALLERIERAPQPAARTHAAWFAVLALTGMRRSEFARSRLEHWNLLGRTVHILGKTGNRDVPFDAALLPYVQRLIKLSKDGSIGPSSKNTISASFQVWSKRLKEPRLHAHALRHTYGTCLVRSGLHDPYTVMALMGHHDLKQMLSYFHVCGVAARRAVEALRLLPPAPEQAAVGHP